MISCLQRTNFVIITITVIRNIKSSSKMQKGSTVGADSLIPGMGIKDDTKTHFA